jgi:hypothetical protein
MWNISTIWVAGQQMMQYVHVKLDTGFSWQKQSSAKIKVSSRANWSLI